MEQGVLATQVEAQKELVVQNCVRRDMGDKHFPDKAIKRHHI